MERFARNFAAGAFMLVLRPVKVGDFVSVGSVTGTVHELGLFGTTIITADNVLTTIGNGKIFGDTIQNFSALPVRRVDRVAQLSGSVDPLEAIERFKVGALTPAACAGAPTDKGKSDASPPSVSRVPAPLNPMPSSATHTKTRRMSLPIWCGYDGYSGVLAGWNAAFDALLSWADRRASGEYIAAMRRPAD